MTSKNCGIFILELRKEKNLTQKELAEKINVSDKAISRWETGKGFPDVNSLLALSKFFEVSVNELLDGKRFKDDNLIEVAEKNIIQTIKTKEKEVKKEKLLTVICAVVLALLILPPALPTLIYFIDTLVTNISFDNISEFVVMLTVSVLLIVAGFTVSKGHISLLHSYHYKNVIDREGYCKSMGKTIMLIGIPLFVASFSVLFPSIPFLEIAGQGITLISLIVGCIFIFKYQYKYNGGLF